MIYCTPLPLKTYFISSQHSKNRPNTDFEITFGKPSGQVISHMDEAGDDVANNPPHIPISLEVGVLRHNIIVQINDLFNVKTTVPLPCTLETFSEVPTYKRGAHMSRIGDAIARLSQGRFSTLQAFVIALTEDLKSGQYDMETIVSAQGNYSYTENIQGREPGRSKLSLEHLGLRAGCTIEGDELRQEAGLSLSHITACPCVQEVVRHAIGDTLQQNQSTPFVTHSQRSKTCVDFRGINDELPLLDLLRTLDQVVFRTCNTLSREQEALLVYRAHEKPQFIEDAVRQVALACHQAFHQRFPEASLVISSVSQEAIHDYDIHASLRASFKQLAEFLKTK